MTDTGVDRSRLYVPSLAPVYDRLRPLAWPMLRIAAGLILVPHGIPKIFGTFAPILAKNVLIPLGMPWPLAVAYFLGAFEIIGGLLFAVGVCTRLLALMFTVEMIIITIFVNIPKGWIYSVPGGGAEFPAFLVIVYLAFVFAGAGRYSIDAASKREL